MPIDSRWKSLTPEQWEAFARDWLAEARILAAAADPEASEMSRRWTGAVTQLCFTAEPAQLWGFLERAMAHAETDDDLSAIAVNLVEHLLGWHGERYIEPVERWAADDPRVARMLTGAWQYKMSDDVWARVQGIQARVANPLPAYRPDA